MREVMTELLGWWREGATVGVGTVLSVRRVLFARWSRRRGARAARGRSATATTSSA